MNGCAEAFSMDTGRVVNIFELGTYDAVANFNIRKASLLAFEKLRR